MNHFIPGLLRLTVGHLRLRGLSSGPLQFCMQKDCAQDLGGNYERMLQFYKASPLGICMQECALVPPLLEDVDARRAFTI